VTAALQAAIIHPPKVWEDVSEDEAQQGVEALADWYGVTLWVDTDVDRAEVTPWESVGIWCEGDGYPQELIGTGSNLSVALEAAAREMRRWV